MPVWPSTLPSSPLLDGFRETVPDNVLRTDMERGPAKTRRRTTSAVRKLSVNYLMSKAQVADLETFYGTELLGGSIAFDTMHPRSAAAISCRFVKPPVYSSANGEYFRVALELEVLP